MVQAARSGRQNIAEGSRAAATSSQTELRLVNVARASLDELLLAYEDFLRQHGLPQWTKDDPQARAVRAVGISGQGLEFDRTDPTDRSDQSSGPGPYAAWLEKDDAGIVANALICLIHQDNYLLDQQIDALERQFIHEGGYSERLASARLEKRREQPDDRGPSCPRCGRKMVSRTARKGQYTGSSFWGCSGYPECNGTRKVE